MQITQPTVPPRSAIKPKSRRPSISPVTSSRAILQEINAYIATRDGLLAAAEKAPNLQSIHRAAIANDVVQVSLRPARPSYAAQHLSEIDAVRELERCKRATRRIIELRSANC